MSLRLVLSSANFRTPVTAGTFSVNGNTVTIATTDTLQSVFDKIYAATGSTVTGTYDPTADKITLSSTSPITLGSSADTSNFLQVAGLYTNSSGTITSTTTLGAVQTTRRSEQSQSGHDRLGWWHRKWRIYDQRRDHQFQCQLRIRFRTSSTASMRRPPTSRRVMIP